MSAIVSENDAGFLRLNLQLDDLAVAAVMNDPTNKAGLNSRATHQWWNTSIDLSIERMVRPQCMSAWPSIREDVVGWILFSLFTCGIHSMRTRPRRMLR